MRDAEQDATSKLAAASALTRQSDPSAIEALQAEKEFLNAASPGLADRLLDAARLRAKLIQFDRGAQFNAPKPHELNASDHPMILEYVGGHGGSIFDRAQGAGGGGGGVFAGEWVNDGDADNRPIDNDHLARLAARCREFGNAWDTHSDAAFQIKRFASPDFGSGQLSGRAMRAIHRNLNRAIRERE